DPVAVIGFAADGSPVLDTNAQLECLDAEDGPEAQRCHAVFQRAINGSVLVVGKDGEPAVEGCAPLIAPVVEDEPPGRGGIFHQKFYLNVVMIRIVCEV